MTTPQASTVRSTFRLEVSVEIDIAAPRERVWALLTDGPGFTGWNSTVTRLDGTIAKGETIELVSTSAPDRVFKLRVAEFDAPHQMVWSDGMAPMFKGVRTYTLSEPMPGTTRFTMTEVFSGIMMPLIAGSLPEFGPVFETFARDLARAAEDAAAT